MPRHSTGYTPTRARIHARWRIISVIGIYNNGKIYCACAGSVCEVLEGLDCESPRRLRTEGQLQGPSVAAAVLPRSPLRLAENTLIIRWPELWLILAGPMASAINNLSAPSSEASGGHLRGCEATSALTTGGSGGDACG